MKAFKITGVVLLGLLGLTVLLYGIGVAVNWRDQPPSAAALEMKRILTDRAPVADADNGFVYVLGFAAPASEDPQRAGALRAAWLAAINHDSKQIDADPLETRIGFSASRSLSMERIASQCGDSHSRECRDAFLAAQAQPRMTLAQLQLDRYRALLQRAQWREVVPLDIRAPLPAYGDIIEGQRLHLVDLAARARSAPPDEIATAVRDDLEFWREMQRSADYLISKMIAVAAIRQHFFFGSLVLREMPAARTKVIEAWSVPFAADELSMRRTMAGELAFAEGAMLGWQYGGEGLTLVGRIGSSLARPYYQHQDQMNYYAASYRDFSRRFDAPLDQYLKIADSMEALEPRGFSFHVYNAVGHVFRELNGIEAFAGYPVRVGSIEGMRRAALLTAQLRERAVPLDQMAGEVSSAELRDPFDGKPFGWSAEEQAVIYTGPDAESSRKRHPYLY